MCLSIGYFTLVNLTQIALGSTKQSIASFKPKRKERRDCGSFVAITNKISSLLYNKRICMQHNTEIEYLLVLDFQATCIEDKKIEPCPEIIQFPIVVVHAHSGKILDKFHEYVKPRFNPILTKFCTELTGITQQMVQNCRPIQEVLQRVEEWFLKLPYIKEDNYTFVTCGDWDLANCLKTEAKHKKLAIKPFLHSYINIKKYYDIVMKTDNRVSGMMKMLEDLGLKHEGKHHSGIDDVLNICAICVELIKNHGATFPKKQINHVKYYFQKGEREQKPEEGRKEKIKKYVPKEGGANLQNVEFDYLLVLDFEATCIKNQKIQPCPEIIEFPVILVDTKNLKKVGTFHHYIKPKHNPQLSDFCTELTGITQAKIANGIHIESALVEFDIWLKSFPSLKEGNFVFVTCGDWDLATCLKLQANVKGLKLQDYFKRYINIKNYFFKVVAVKEKVTGMMDMLRVLGIEHQGKHHSGIDDVANISNICLHLLAHHKATFPKKEVTLLDL